MRTETTFEPHHEEYNIDRIMSGKAEDEEEDEELEIMEMLIKSVSVCLSI